MVATPNECSQQEILDVFKSLNDEASGWDPVNRGSDAYWTKAVKGRLVSLGRRHDYYVCCHGADDGTANWGEWLYDLCWLKKVDDTDLLLYSEMTLAMESEWIMKPWELMNDFQKLVFSDARICLMVWQNRNDEALQKDVELLQKQIRLAGDDPSRHLLVGYDLCEKRFAVERSSVSP